MKRIIKFKSSDRIHELYGVYFIPEGEPLGIIQVVHGMCEYFERYTFLIDFFTNRGYIVCGHDHLGHGKSAKDGEFGYFGEEDGHKFLVNDTYIFSKIIKGLYPKLPLIIYGHSMGSFILRNYIVAHTGMADKIVLGGTGEPKLMANFGDILCYYSEKFREDTKPNPLVDSAMSMMNLKFWIENRSISSVGEWISRDKKVVDEFTSDKHSKFSFSNNANRELYKLISLCTLDKWYEQVNKKLPILIIGGTDDPLGEFGYGTRRFYKKLLANRVEDAHLILYNKARHELHNEINREEVFLDILEFIEKK